MEANWPARALYNTYERRDEKRSSWKGPASWMGSLVQHGRDASGQYYRRNRYYDATTGRFTQEDPIGLAGGTNLYGYANGDPVGYSDPYGLKVNCGNARACEMYSRVYEQALEASMSRDVEVRDAGQRLLGVFDALNGSAKVFTIHAKKSRNPFRALMGNAVEGNFSARCGGGVGGGCGKGDAATATVNTHLISGISAEVRLVHELRHIYEHEIKGRHWRENSQNGAINVENDYRTIRKCEARPQTDSEGGWRGPACQ
jgi:RHS repeat-associated protein